MKVDTTNSIFREAPEAKNDFSRRELRSLRLLLRRLHFLESNVAQNEGRSDLSGGAAFAEWEMEALEFVLIEVGYLVDPRPQNTRIKA